MSTVENSVGAWDGRAVAAASSHEAALWSAQGQAARFLHALRRADVQGGDSVLDYGCGTGSLSGWLPDGVEYTGLDWSPEMVARAKREHPGREFVQDIIGRRFDHVLCIGPFNLPDRWTKGQTSTTLALLWERTDKTLVASLYHGDDPRCLRYSLAEVGRWAEASGARLAAVDATYLENDLMLVLKR